MFDEIDDFIDIDISLYKKWKGLSRTTKEQISPRVYLIRTEQIYHKYHTSSYASVIKVDKYIDDNLVNSYSWIQPVTAEEIKELIPDKQKKFRAEEKREYDRKYYQRKKLGLIQPKPKLTEEEKKEKARKKFREYYQRNKEKLNAQKRKYYHEHKDKVQEYNKQYYKDHIDEFKDYYLKNKTD